MRSSVPDFISFVALAFLLLASPSAATPPEGANLHPPGVNITNPPANAKVKINVPVSLKATTFDLEDGAECTNVEWRVNGVKISTSSSASYTFKKLGSAVISFTAKDSGGQKTTKTISVTVKT